MGKLTIEEVIEFHKGIIEDSDQEGDKGQGGQIINYGNLSIIIEFSTSLIFS